MKFLGVLLSLCFAASSVQAAISKWGVATGYVYSWDREYVTLITEKKRLQVPRAAFKKQKLKKWTFVKGLIYKTSDTPAHKAFVRALKKMPKRTPASSR